MKNKLEAIKEAICFIKNNWIGKLPYWEGEPHEFVGATLFGDVTKVEVRQIIKALKKGEHVDVTDLDGEIQNGELISVRVLR
jgi:hypothetical protein